MKNVIGFSPGRTSAFATCVAALAFIASAAAAVDALLEIVDDGSGSGDNVFLEETDIVAQCAILGETCSCPDGTVYYGVGAAQTFEEMIQSEVGIQFGIVSTIACDNAAFGGDPAPDVPKQCWCVNQVGSDVPTAVTIITASLESGDTYLPTESHDGFHIGDVVVIGKGSESQETNVVAGFGSIILKYPLKFAHGPGTTIETAIGEEPSSEPEVTTTSKTPSTTAVAEEDMNGNAGGSNKSLSAGVAAGITVSVLVFAALLIGGAFIYQRRSRKGTHSFEADKHFKKKRRSSSMIHRVPDFKENTNFTQP